MTLRRTLRRKRKRSKTRKTKKGGAAADDVRPMMEIVAELLQKSNIHVNGPLLSDKIDAIYNNIEEKDLRQGIIQKMTATDILKHINIKPIFKKMTAKEKVHLAARINKIPVTYQDVVKRAKQQRNKNNQRKFKEQKRLNKIAQQLNNQEQPIEYSNENILSEMKKIVTEI
tara:strand:+ start:1489 stop:2001 length:513 start_codon:yes stop_codon:yes gene_type:complete